MHGRCSGGRAARVDRRGRRGVGPVGQAHEKAHTASVARPVYGRTTGVGANRHAVVDPAARASTACASAQPRRRGGQLLDEPGVRARADPAQPARRRRQRRAPPPAAGAADGAAGRRLPLVHARGAIGTGDLTALAEVALTLAGQRPWAAGSLDPRPRSAPGTRWRSCRSNAATLAQAVLAWSELDRLLRASHVVAALSYCALAGSPEAYAERVHARRPHPGSVRAAAEMRRLLRHEGELSPGGGSRTRSGCARSRRCTGPPSTPPTPSSGCSPSTSTPRPRTRSSTSTAGEVYHHGQFSTAYLALALDHARAARCTTSPSSRPPASATSWSPT